MPCYAWQPAPVVQPASKPHRNDHRSRRRPEGPRVSISPGRPGATRKKRRRRTSNFQTRKKSSSAAERPKAKAFVVKPHISIAVQSRAPPSGGKAGTSEHSEGHASVTSQSRLNAHAKQEGKMIRVPGSLAMEHFGKPQSLPALHSTSARRKGERDTLR